MDRSINIRIPTRWLRLAGIAAVVALVAFPAGVLAADRFKDVPNTNVFHDDISWLADANVTRGCNPPTNDEFCPKDNVTREQMAAFMRRLAQNKVVDAKTAITADTAKSADTAKTAANADKVDGFDANQLIRADFFQQTDPRILLTSTTYTALGTMSITTETDCLLIMNGTIGWDDNNTSAQLWLQWRVNGDNVGPEFIDEDGDTARQVNQSHNAVAVAAVQGGETYTVRLMGKVQTNDLEADVKARGMFVLCVPFDGAGNPLVAGGIASFQLPAVTDD